jgi:hypothetical protein
MLQRKAQQGRYQEAAARVMDIEGLPSEASGSSSGKRG